MMKIQILSEIRLPSEPNKDWPRYKRRNYQGSFSIGYTGLVLLPVGDRVPLYRYGGREPIGTVHIERVELTHTDLTGRLETSVMFRDFKEASK